MGAFGAVKSEVEGQNFAVPSEVHVLSVGDTASGQLMWILKIQLKADQAERKISLCIRTPLCQV